MNDFASDLNLVGDTISFLSGHVGEQDLFACFFVFDNIGAWMDIRAVLDQAGKSNCVNSRDTLRERQFSGHKDRDTNLIGSDHGIGGNDRASTEVDTLAHHLHAEHALLPLEELPDALLLLVDSLLGH